MAAAEAQRASRSYMDQTGVSEEGRFVLELEFVQCLANPHYLNWLAQNNYLQDSAFLNYLKHLDYWRQPQYAQYIRFPHCLFMLEMLQSEHFRQAIALPQVMDELHTQQAFYWQHYRTNRIKEAAAAGGSSSTDAGPEGQQPLAVAGQLPPAAAGQQQQAGG